MSNVIFLDVDGVLNDSQTIDLSPEGYVGVKNELIKNLQTLVEEFSAIIILTSDWKHGWDIDCNKCTEDAKYLNTRLAEFNLSIEEKTLDQSKGLDASSKRGWGIKEYLRTHDVDNWVVLDDVYFKDFDDEISKHFVHTVSWKGLTESKLETARLILSGTLNNLPIPNVYF